MSDKILVLRGTLDWAKVLGKARPYTGNPKFDKGPYWSVDITPDRKSRELMKAFGITKKLREPKGEKDTRTETYLSLKVLENRADGNKNSPPKVKDVKGEDWSETKLIGNGTVADIKVKVVDYGSAAEKGVYLQAIRILDHVSYETEDFEPLSEDDEFFGAAANDSKPEPAGEAAFDQDQDLDDDVPF